LIDRLKTRTAKRGTCSRPGRLLPVVLPPATGEKGVASHNGVEIDKISPFRRFGVPTAHFGNCSADDHAALKGPSVASSRADSGPVSALAFAGRQVGSTGRGLRYESRPRHALAKARRALPVRVRRQQLSWGFAPAQGCRSDPRGGGDRRLRTAASPIACKTVHMVNRGAPPVLARDHNSRARGSPYRRWPPRWTGIDGRFRGFLNIRDALNVQPPPDRRFTVRAV